MSLVLVFYGLSYDRANDVQCQFWMVSMVLPLLGGDAILGMVNGGSV